jgi:hypothetical protein
LHYLQICEQSKSKSIIPLSVSLEFGSLSNLTKVVVPTAVSVPKTGAATRSIRPVEFSTGDIEKIEQVGKGVFSKTFG